MGLLKSSPSPDARVDLSGVDYMDGAGVALLLTLKQKAGERGGALTLINLSEQYQHLVDLTWDADLSLKVDQEKDKRGLAEQIGRATDEVLEGLREMVSFVGEATVMILASIRHPAQVRWKDVLLSCITVGVDSLFIITLIGFLMGLIMSFQSAISLQRFGGEIFVPNMLGLIMYREMGPLVTAILLAARSGSAFAAEIGTMKINEELDALTTMGLSPMRFLVVPKLLSSLAMVPLMTMFFNLASLVGGAVVMLSMGFPLVTFNSRVFTYLNFAGFWGGIIKSLVFAVLVAGVGCLRGMQTRSGASAVGLSTTKRRGLGHHRHRFCRRAVRGGLLLHGNIGMERSEPRHPRTRPHLRLRGDRHPRRRLLRRQRRRGLRHPRRVGLRQVHAAQEHDRPVPAHGRPGPVRRGRPDLRHRGRTGPDHPQVRGDVPDGRPVRLHVPVAERPASPGGVYRPLRRSNDHDRQVQAGYGQPGDLALQNARRPVRGMKKRAAIARAMALDPKILFLDEPGAGLDPISSAELDELILNLSRTLGITFVIVTHELDSIYNTADRIIMLDKDAKTIVAEGDPRELRDSSTVPLVRQFFHRQASRATAADHPQTATEQR